MLTLMVFPPVIHADDARTPFDYLKKDEQDYAGRLRGAVADAKSHIAPARADLGTCFLQGYDEWAPAVLKQLESLNDDIYLIKAMTAPATFSDLQAKCQALHGMNVGVLAMFLGVGGTPDTLIETAQIVSNLEGGLGALDGELSGILSALEAQIEKVGKQREKEAQELGGDILNAILSCEETSIG